MPLFGSRPSSRAGSVSAPSSRPGSRGPSRGTSPVPAGGKVDSLRIEGNLYDILKPQPAITKEEEILPKELNVVLRYNVSFMLSKAVRCTCLKAEYRTTMLVTTDEGDGQFQEATREEEEIVRLDWTIWRGSILEPGQEYVFEFNGELPRQTPRSLKTPRGRIEHSLTVWMDGVTDSGRMRRTKKTVEVWNPFSMDADDPRPGLDFHNDLGEIEMVGTSMELEKGLEAFIRFPDQCYKGIGRSFPCEVSIPTASLSQLHSFTHISIDILQLVWFLRPGQDKVKPELLAQDIYPITSTASIQPSSDPQRVTLPLPDPIIHGRFTSPHLRVRHQLRITFHRKWLGRKIEWLGDVEIFHRDVGWEARGIQGVQEVVRGQEEDYPPIQPDVPLNTSQDMS